MIRAGIVGVGWWGRALVEAARDGSDRLRFVAAVTRSNTVEQRRFAEEQKLRLHDSYDELLANANVDAVVLATPPALHGDQILAAAAAGKHVFIEKPFVATKAEAVEAVQAAEKAGITLGLGYNRRFHPTWKDLCERVHSGQLGTILHLASTMTAPNGLTMSATAWRASRQQAPCGGLFPMAVHALDGMIDLCGEFEEAYAKSYRAVVPNDVDDTTAVVLKMASGPTATIATMMATAAGSRFEVFGSEGRAELQGTTHTAGQTSVQRRVGVFGSYVVCPVSGEPQRIEVPPFDSVVAELDAFASACTGRTEFPIGHSEMIAGAAVAEAIIKSAASGNVEYV